MMSLFLRIVLFLAIFKFGTLSPGLNAGQDAGFKRAKIRLGNQVLAVDVADTNETRAKGLMYRKSLPEGEGCLFVFDDEAVRSFWMKNTYIPLSIGFFDRAGRLFEIQDMQPMDSGAATPSPPKVYKSLGPAKYALEVPKGWFGRAKLKVGVKFEFL